jgi:hypothetical protein
MHMHGVCVGSGRTKEKIMTIMQNAPGDPPVERIDNLNFGATEPDNTHLYIPKSLQGQMDITSMQKTRFLIPSEIYGPVRNHTVVVLTSSANIVDRRRSLAQLRTMAAAGDEQATAVLEAMSGLMLD